MSDLRAKAKTKLQLKGSDCPYPHETDCSNCSAVCEVEEAKMWVLLSDAEAEVEKWRKQQKEDYTTYVDKVEKLQKQLKELDTTILELSEDLETKTEQVEAAKTILSRKTDHPYNDEAFVDFLLVKIADLKKALNESQSTKEVQAKKN